MQHAAASLVAALLALGLGPSLARAGGLWVWEAGTAADIGTAGASWGAGMDDASTAWANPAAMTLVERTELGLQVSPGLYRHAFDTDSANTTSGGSGANTEFVPLLGSSVVWAGHPRLRIGAALGGIAGGALDYGDDWAGRYLVSEVSLNVLGFSPGLAWRVNDRLSVGASLMVCYAGLEQKARVNNLLPGQPDGKLRIEDSDVAVGGVFGLLYEPWEGTRIALTYRTPIDFDLRDEVDFGNIRPPLAGIIGLAGLRDATVRVDMDMPQQVLLGIRQRLTDELDLVANVDWEDWSTFQSVELELASQAARSVSADVDSRDTWHVGVGLRWRPRPRWELTTGVAYDSSMFSDGNRSPVLPVDRQIRAAAGVQYDWNDDVFVGFSYTYMNGGDARLRAGGGPLTGTLSGDYEDNDFHFFTISINWRP